MIESVLVLPPEPEIVDFAWLAAAMIIGMMGIYLAAVNQIGRAGCPGIVPLFYVSIAGLLLVNLNKSYWFQESLIDVLIEVGLIVVIVSGAAYVFHDQLTTYGLQTPRQILASVCAGPDDRDDDHDDDRDDEHEQDCDRCY